MRAALAVPLLLAGALTGVATVVLHPTWWGLALGVGATAAALMALPRGWSTRLAFALGFTALVGWVAGARPEGDYLISGDLQGYLLLGAAVAVMLVGVATLPPPGGHSGRP